MKFTPEQEQAITGTARRICVSAGAGSGKTRILIERMLRLLDSPELWPDQKPRLDGIVALTFAEKAAAEMKARLRRGFAEKAKAATGDTRKFWRELVREADGARASTIHSFCASFLRENALRLGLSPDTAVLSDAENVLLKERVVAEVLDGLLEAGDAGAEALYVEYGGKRLKDALRRTIEQRAVLRDIAARMPGDQTPETLAAEWKRLAGEVFDREILALASPAALKPVLDELKALETCINDENDGRAKRLQHAVTLLERATLPGAGPQEIRTALAELGKAGDYLPRASDKKWTDRDSYDRADALLKDLHALGQKIASLDPEGDPEVEMETARRTLAFLSIAQRVIARFAERKEALECQDFDDQIDLTRRILAEDRELCERTARGIAFLLVDEFQDTDRAQLEIANLLCATPGGPSLFIVGDAKQSIYLFRGAEVGVFRQAGAAADQRVALDTNFRSTPEVLAFVNQFFRETSLLAAVEDYGGMKTHRPASGRASVEFFLPPDTGEKVKAEEAHKTEAAFIAARIREMVHGPEPVTIGDPDGRRPAAYGDIALLFRRFTHVHHYEEALRAADIPYCLGAGRSFYKRQEVLDVLHLLQTVCDPWNETALLCFLRGPFAALSDDALARMAMADPHRGGLARVFHGGEPPEGFPEADRLARARDLLRRVRELRGDPPGPALRRALELSGAEAVCLGQHQGMQKASNLAKLVTVADEFSPRLPATLADFVRYLDDVRDRAVQEGDANLQTGGGDAVLVMTIHASKGLEFPVVFLPDLCAQNKGRNGGGTLHLHRDLGAVMDAGDLEKTDDDTAKPVMVRAVRLAANRGEEEESARLLYVAMTRARDHLVLCGLPKAVKGTWFAHFNAAYALAEKEHGGAVAGDGWKAFVRREIPALCGPAPTPDRGEMPDVDALRARIAPFAPPARAGITVSVSALLNWMVGDEGGPGEDPPATEKEATDREFAMDRGTAVHRFFELWDFAGDNAGLPDRVLDESDFDPGQRETLRAQLARMAERFREDPLHARLAADTGFRRELPFLLPFEGHLIRGTIDALLGDGTVLDYKTGAPNAEKGERYGLQLALYAEAVRQVTGAAPGEGLLYFVDRALVERVPLGPENIAAALERARQILRERGAGRT